jgi:hypothetical protein
MIAMNFGRKSLYWLLTYLTFAFVLAWTVPSFIHRRDFDIAYETWRKSPTPENEAAFRVQERKNELIHLQDSLLGAVLLVGLGLVAYGGLRLTMKYLKRSD